MERIAELVTRVEHGDIANVREDARVLLTEVLAWHRQALARLILDVDPDKLAEAARDPMIASLLELHEIEVPAPAKLVPLAGLLKKAPLKSERHGTACELCAKDAGDLHPHLIDVGTRMLICACGPCATTLDAGPTGKYARVPDRVLCASDLAESDAWWHALGVPSGVAFFVPRGETQAVSVFYPGPAGATESSVPREIWDEAARVHSSLARVTPYVEALVVDRADGAREHWVCGVDRAYELVARVREPWQGLTGGDGVRAVRRRFFATLAEEARR
jgi:hypothetical protein